MSAKWNIFSVSYRWLSGKSRRKSKVLHTLIYSPIRDSVPEKLRSRFYVNHKKDYDFITDIHIERIER